MSMPLFLRLVSETYLITSKASGIVRQVLKSGNLKTIDKGIDDLQTKADRAAQQYITSRILAKFPQVSIIGEEGTDLSEDVEVILSSVAEDLSPAGPGGAESESIPSYPSDFTNVPEHIKNIQENEVLIWLDPLDGTREFVQGLITHTTMLVGLSVNGKAVGGVINQPFYKQVDGQYTGRTVWGINGVGYGGVQVVKPPSDKLIITTSRSRTNKLVEAAIQSLNPDEILKVGGAGHKGLILMEGLAHAYVYSSAGSKKWDICAVEAVLKSMGGNLTDIDGKSYLYHDNVDFVNKRGILATAPGEDHAWYAQKLTVTPAEK